MEWRHETWAEALWVERNKRNAARGFIAERIAALDAVGDRAGVARWRNIAEAYERLQNGRRQ